MRPTTGSGGGSLADGGGALTPMMLQYRELKRRYPDYLLLFRLGDFYETFFEDAEVAARLLQITLTSRQGAPMAGIPHHAADGYLARLVRAGRKIAISEQLETPGRTKQRLKGDVVRIITPGTITDTACLAGAANNFLLAVVRGREARGVALLDVSTGEFWVGEDGAREDAVLSAALLRRPAEILVPGATREDRALLARLEAAGATLTFWEPVAGGARSAAADLCAHFQVDALDRFGVGDMTAGQEAAALALGYLRATQGDALGHLRHLTRLTAVDSMGPDATAVETLELLQGSDGGAGSSLFGVLDETVTAMGARLLRQWLLRPLLDPEAVVARQIAVAALVDQPARRARLRALLRPVGDLERLTSRAALGQAHARDLVGLRACLEPLGRIREACEGIEAPLIAAAASDLADLESLRALLEAALVDEPPLTLHDGGIIRESWDDTLATIVRDAREARDWIARLDALASLAEVAHARGHVRPVVDRGEALTIADGRHPVLEARPGVVVTPNDLAQDGAGPIVILTGPNMSGKSVYLRQTAHIVILAQMGAFVPAREARIGVIDRIFTRVGAQDNLARGQSTFLVEMVETATILNNVTPRSLVLLDEVGRGTSTFDVLAIAWAVVEALHEQGRGAKGLFATHFHELTRLAGRLPGVRNFHVAGREWNDEIIFLHKVQPGATDRSYGIQVARLAGLPPEVIARAKALLAELEEAGQVRADARDAVQLGLFASAAPGPIVTELTTLDLAHLTPLEALNLLHKWQARAVGAGAARPARAVGVRAAAEGEASL